MFLTISLVLSTFINSQLMIRLKNGTRDTVKHTTWQQRTKQTKCVQDVMVCVGNWSGVTKDGVRMA